MKNQLLAFLISIFLACIQLLSAQSNVKVDDEYRTSVVEQLSKMIIENYVYEDVAQKTVNHLKKQLENGTFDKYENLEEFAKALTETVQFVNKDKHMRIRLMPPREAPENTPERMVEDQLYRLQRSREQTAGFMEARKIEGNIGYLDLRGFAGMQIGAPAADHYMYLLSTSDAIIIDLRKNGGGSPSMVQYLCSYFFDEKIHLNSLYWRAGDRTDEFWTLDKVGGKKLPDVPLFVLTSPRTFSGAEEFSYNMQTRKRATLIGETTGGGANPGGVFRINKDLTVFIPTGAAINPVTKTNWEGIGVVPEVKIEAEKALDKAIELAKAAAENFKNSKQSEYKKLLTSLYKDLNSLSAGSSTEAIFKQVKNCYEMGLLSEGNINGMGYTFMENKRNTYAAEALFKANTMLFPNSANVYDSYGEALVINGKLDKAIKSYKKAVEVGKANSDENLELYQENLEKVKQKANQDK